MPAHKGLRAKVEGRGRIIAGIAAIATVLAVGVTGVSVADGDRATYRGKIGSAQIKNGGLYSPDYHNGSVRSTDIRDKGVHGNDLADRVNQRINRTNIWFDQHGSTPTTIEHIGGSISANYTDLGLSVTLPKGTYLFDVSGIFASETAASDPSVEVQPQLSLWFDHDGDGAFEWDAPDHEGGISPNAYMPSAANRHVSTSGKQYVVLLERTTVHVIAHGYASDQSSARSGEIDVVQATLTATAVR